MEAKMRKQPLLSATMQSVLLTVWIKKFNFFRAPVGLRLRFFPNDLLVSQDCLGQLLSTAFDTGEGDDALLLEELEKQQIVLSQCAEQLETYEKSRDVLVQQIKEILHEQVLAA